MAKLRQPPVAIALANIEIRRPSERCDQLIQNLFAFGLALLRHHIVGVLYAGMLLRHRN
jgi:hypothetical protein